MKTEYVTELTQEECRSINGGGWLSTLIGSAFVLLGNWVVSLFNEGLEIIRE